MAWAVAAASSRRATSASSTAPLTSSARSMSIRATCWFRVVARRVLRVVGRDGSTMRPVAERARASIRPRRSAAAGSSPTTPTRVTAAPSARALCATLAAPPGRLNSRSSSRTGTGASGEMRVTRPIMKWSSITSPMTTRCVAADAVEQVEGARARQRREQRDVDHGRPPSRSAAKGRVTSTRNSMRNSESPKLYSKRPAASMAATAASPPAASDGCRVRAQSPPRAAGHRGQEPQPHRQRRQAALGGDLHRHVVQVRVVRLDRPRHPVARVDARDHVGADAGERVIADDGLARFEHGQAVPVGRVVPVEHRVDAVGDRRRCGRDEHRHDNRQETDEAPILQQEQGAHPRRHADPGAAGEGQAQSGDQRRHDQRRPHAVARVEEQPGHGGADDQHQGARVGHPVGQRALRPPAEVVVVEHAVLDDADQGAGRPDRQRDGGQRSRARAPAELVDHGHEQEEHELLGVGHADGGVARQRRRQQRERGIGGQRPREARHLRRAGQPGPRHPRQRGGGHGDLRDGNRELQRRHGGGERPPAHAVEALQRGRLRLREGDGRHDPASSTRSAAASTSSGVSVVRQRKSPCTHTR